jgi:cytochrome c5
MINKIVILVVIAGAIIACNKKAVPVITERKYETPNKIVMVYPPPGTVSPDTIEGKAIFMARCRRCHELPEPNLYTSKRWDGILTSMLPKARIKGEQAVHIAAYLKANAQK